MHSPLNFSNKQSYEEFIQNCLYELYSERFTKGVTSLVAVHMSTLVNWTIDCEWMINHHPGYNRLSYDEKYSYSIAKVKATFFRFDDGAIGKGYAKLSDTNNHIVIISNSQCFFNSNNVRNKKRKQNNG